jgi:hypothetical protein
MQWPELDRCWPSTSPPKVSNLQTVWQLSPLRALFRPPVSPIRGFPVLLCSGARELNPFATHIIIFVSQAGLEPGLTREVRSHSLNVSFGGASSLAQHLAGNRIRLPKVPITITVLRNIYVCRPLRYHFVRGFTVTFIQYCSAD